MATKEQERKALQKIKNIIEEVGGADSYIGMAFEGAFDIANDNIDNDWGNSCQFFIEHYRNNWEKVDRKELDKVESEREEWKSIAKEKSDHLEQTQKALNTTLGNAHELNDRYAEAVADLHKAEALVQAKEDEIIRLKAKLYDLMTA